MKEKSGNILIGCYPSISEETAKGSKTRVSALEERLGHRIKFDGYILTYPKTNSPKGMNEEHIIKNLIEGRKILVNIEQGGDSGTVFNPSINDDKKSNKNGFGNANLTSIRASWENKTQDYYLQVTNFLEKIKLSSFENKLQNHKLNICFTTLHEVNDNNYVWGLQPSNNIFKDYQFIFGLFIKLIDEIFPSSEYPNIKIINWLNRYNGKDSMFPLIFEENNEKRSLIHDLSDSDRLIFGFTNYIRAGDTHENFYRPAEATSRWIIDEYLSLPEQLRPPIMLCETSVNSKCGDQLIDTQNAWKELGIDILNNAFFAVNFFLDDVLGRNWNIKEKEEIEIFIKTANSLQKGVPIQKEPPTTKEKNLCTDPYFKNLSTWFIETTTGESSFESSNILTPSSHSPSWSTCSHCIEIDTGGMGKGFANIVKDEIMPWEDGYKRRFYQKITGLQKNDVIKISFSARVSPNEPQDEAYIDVGVRQGIGGKKVRHKVRLTKKWKKYGGESNKIYIPVKFYNDAEFYKAPYFEIGMNKENTKIQITEIKISKYSQPKKINH